MTLVLLAERLGLSWGAGAKKKDSDTKGFAAVRPFQRTLRSMFPGKRDRPKSRKVLETSRIVRLRPEIVDGGRSDPPAKFLTVCRRREELLRQGG